MGDYNPLFMEELKSVGLTPSDSWGLEPIQRFGRYQFNNSEDAVNFIKSPSFLNFWDKNKAGINNVGIRTEINDSGRYAESFPTKTYGDEKLIAETNRARRLANPNIKPETAEKAYNQSLLKARATGRFYSTLTEPSADKSLAFYLNNATEKPVPIRVIADKRFSNFSLKDRVPFDGLIDPKLSFSDKLIERYNLDLSKTYGTNLGAALSSNPQNEAFVSGQLASQEARVAGRVFSTPYSAKGHSVIQLHGMPKVSVPMQVLGNINRVGGAVAERATAPIALGMMAYGATRDNYLDREYGHTDQFGLRPAWDFMGKISGMYEDSNTNKATSIPQAWREMKTQVADPDWIERNQISAVPYNMVLNTGDFVQGLKDAYRPFFTMPNIQRYDIAGAR